jgi:hypothetical protein
LFFAVKLLFLKRKTSARFWTKTSYTTTIDTQSGRGGGQHFVFKVASSKIRLLKEVRSNA